jgi:hypothetical protein
MTVPLVGTTVVFVEATGEQRAGFITKVHKGSKSDEVDLAFHRPVSERQRPKPMQVEPGRVLGAYSKAKERERIRQWKPPQPGEVKADTSYAVAKVPRCGGFDKTPGHWFFR